LAQVAIQIELRNEAARRALAPDPPGGRCGCASAAADTARRVRGARAAPGTAGVNKRAVVHVPTCTISRDEWSDK
jgi:hypothetical protein